MASNMIEYKDYCGSVEYSDEDECFFGKIIDIPDLVTFEGNSISALKKSFHEMVDDYIIQCENLGKTPLKKYEGSLNVTIPPNLHKEAAITAIKRGISLDEFIQKAIADKLSV